MSTEDTYEKPAHGWTCFFCGETFTTVGAAQIHFGALPEMKPGCYLKVSFGAERGLLVKLRRVEEELAKLYKERAEDDTHLHRELHRQQTRHVEALQTAEELGYERGLRAVRPEDKDNERDARLWRKLEWFSEDERDGGPSRRWWTSFNADGSITTVEKALEKRQ